MVFPLSAALLLVNAFVLGKLFPRMGERREGQLPQRGRAVGVKFPPLVAEEP